ncbi:38467_t:CDS:1, partial [Gigaspora margarita]
NEFTQSIITKTHNVDKTIAYWTREKMLTAKPLHSPSKEFIFRNKTINSGEKNSFFTVASDLIKSESEVNAPYSVEIKSESEVNTPLPVGILFFTLHNDDYTCTASVITTKNGNTGITAAHCLYSDGEYSENVMFCPGYNNGTESFLGKIVVAKTSVPDTYIDFDDDDYGGLKFYFNGSLQWETGAFGWGINPPDQVSIVVFGYPADGDMNCTRNGDTCCTWRGNATLITNQTNYPPLRMVSAYLGVGSSGGPWLIRYESPTHDLGYLIGITAFHFGEHDEYSDVLNFTLVNQLTNW